VPDLFPDIVGYEAFDRARKLFVVHAVASLEPLDGGGKLGAHVEELLHHLHAPQEEQARQQAPCVLGEGGQLQTNTRRCNELKGRFFILLFYNA